MNYSNEEPFLNISRRCKYEYIFNFYSLPIPVAARSKAQVFGSSPAEIVGSNLTGRGGHGRLSVVRVVC